MSNEHPAHGNNTELYSRIYISLNAIPAGSVVTYGTLARLTGCGPRQVGRALRTLPKDSKLPWFRVINSRGRISLPAGEGYEVQRWHLTREGVEFKPSGCIDLKSFGWEGSDG